MDRIARAFAEGKQDGRALFIAYCCAGDPDEERSFAACQTLLERGADILEVGVPFSDPLADGLTNQLAAERALAAGMTQDKVFALVQRLRAVTDKPIVFYTYYNLVHACGIEAYVERAHAAGVDAILTLDLPPEEAGEMVEACTRHDVKTVFIIAATTPAERIPTITGAATGFIYYVSREGVTGVRKDVAHNLAEATGRIRTHTELPVVVGFGISSREQVREVAQHADGVVVGSAIVNAIQQHAASVSSLREGLGGFVEDLASGAR